MSGPSFHEVGSSNRFRAWRSLESHSFTHTQLTHSLLSFSFSLSLTLTLSLTLSPSLCLHRLTAVAPLSAPFVHRDSPPSHSLTRSPPRHSPRFARAILRTILYRVSLAVYWYMYLDLLNISGQTLGGATVLIVWARTGQRALCGGTSSALSTTREPARWWKERRLPSR